MLNCSVYQREQKQEITLFIAGWALIKQRDSGSCLLQHLSNRKHHKSLKQLPCPSSAGESCSQKERWLSRQRTQPLRASCAPSGQGDTSLSEEMNTFCHVRQTYLSKRWNSKRSTPLHPDCTPSVSRCLWSGDAAASSSPQHWCFLAWRTPT